MFSRILIESCHSHVMFSRVRVKGRSVIFKLNDVGRYTIQETISEKRTIVQFNGCFSSSNMFNLIRDKGSLISSNPKNDSNFPSQRIVEYFLNARIFDIVQIKEYSALSVSKDVQQYLSQMTFVIVHVTACTRLPKSKNVRRMINNVRVKGCSEFAKWKDVSYCSSHKIYLIIWINLYDYLNHLKYISECQNVWHCPSPKIFSTVQIERFRHCKSQRVCITCCLSKNVQHCPSQETFIPAK